MVFVDIDGDAKSTFNSSSATFSIQVTVIELFMQVSIGVPWPLRQHLAPENVKFKIPGSVPIVIFKQLIRILIVIYYKDVTNVVECNSSNPSGEYFVADVSTTEGQNSSAGWSLVIVYEDPTENTKIHLNF